MPNVEAHRTPERWARPSTLRLDLGVSVGSRLDNEAAEFGWEVWRGTISAAWDLDDADPDTLPPLDGRSGWRDAKPHLDEVELTLRVGELERWLLRLDGADLGNPAPLAIDSPMALFEAGDAMSSDLAELMEALMGDGDDRMFCEDCYKIGGEEWLDFDRLLILREIEIMPQLRGHGVGAWASARSVGLLARDVGTLLATLAAPLHRSEFLTGAAGDEHREMTAAEDTAWHAAQIKIARHWQSTIGLTPLPRHRNVLVGTVETTREAMENSLDPWTDRDYG
jgi:hypothetical protein